MRRFFPPAALIAALCACAQTPVRYAPAAAPSARLPTAKLPKLLLGEVADQTRGGEFVTNGVGGIPSEWNPDVEWAEIVRDAFVLELQRLGWPTTESRTSAGARMMVSVRQARAEWNRPGVSLPVKGKLVIDVVLQKSPDGEEVWSGPLEGAGRGTIGSGGSPQNGIREAWNAALASAMAKLAPLLADERPWEKLAGERAAPLAAAPEPAPSSSDIDELPAARAARPHSYAVVIGVEHYREKLPNADFAADDAKLVAAYFERALGVPEANVATLTDDRATKSDFEKYFESWLPNHIEAGDTVYVYYSGHGAPNPAKGDSYLVPYDGDPTYTEKTGYSVKRLFDQLAKLPAKQVYVAMDSCFSGAGGRSVIAQGARPLVSVVQADVPANLTVLAASAGDQISNSYREKGHGLFTYYFLKGLKEKGDDFHAVFDYLKPEVARTARREFNADQFPQWRQGK
ncbi:MAG: caspase domain-containing protein [Elusimicrobiota bacterium]